MIDVSGYVPTDSFVWYAICGPGRGGDGQPPQNSYVFGGSGRSRRSPQCLEYEADAWDGATGIERVQPDSLVFTAQGDGDMASEGLHENLHAGARGAHITRLTLNNGVFGDTGGHMT